MNSKLKDQLIMKFQLALFIALQGKPFNLYEDFANFERDVHKVDLGTGYLADTSCREILSYLSKSILRSNITKLLNHGTVRYYSIHNDGSSSAKTMDEKELFIMKTTRTGEVKFHIMSLEEPDEATTKGVKAALETSIMKMGLNIERKDREIGMCTDGAVNIKLHRLVKAEIGEHYLLTLCPGHKMELAIKDVFELLTLNNQNNDDYLDIFYLSEKQI